MKSSINLVSEKADLPLLSKGQKHMDFFNGFHILIYYSFGLYSQNGRINSPFPSL